MARNKSGKAFVHKKYGYGCWIYVNGSKRNKIWNSLKRNRRRYY